jgi:peptidoglycan/LPS O-acetylase OafA/YrhL
MSDVLTVEEGAAAGRDPGGFVYHPALDGVRALAVTAVVAFHYPPERVFRGGFLGVDAFFVLSGFLITTLLLDEHRRTGSVSLRKFYARRALRLLPAAAVLLVIGVALRVFLSSTDATRPTTFGLVAIVAYVANWAQIVKPGSLGELSHAWSLAIEEQFYLVWPAAVLFLLWRGVKTRTLLAVIGSGIVASACWRIVVWKRSVLPHTNFVDFYFRVTARTPPSGHVDPLLYRIHVWDRWYFGTDTRADSLLVGCFLAVVLVSMKGRTRKLAWRLSRAVTVAGLLGSAVIMWRAKVFLSGWVPDWGVLAFEVCVALVIAGIVMTPGGVVARTLALPPLVWTGRRSYAIYLFHPIVFRFLNTHELHTTPPTAFVLSIAAVAAAAEISYRAIEAPALRFKTRFRAETRQ